MRGYTDEPIDQGDTDDSDLSEAAMTLLLGSASAVLFGLGCLVSEAAGEIAVDVDLKPFFLPYLLIAISSYGLRTLSIGLGAAVGEGLVDVLEGYELDEPIGFLGYVLGFTAFGWYLDEVATDRTAPRSLLAGATIGAFVQAVFEGFAFFAFESAAGVLPTTISVLGNTATHGVLLGGLPLLLLFPRLRDHVDLLPPS